MLEATREDLGTVRQQPWVTYILMLVLLITFVYARAEQRSIDAELSGALSDAADYFRAHPYLSAPPQLEAQLGTAQVERLRLRFQQAALSRSAPPIPPGIQRREQERLDDLVGEAAGRLSEHPTLRWGMHAGEQRPLSLLSHVLLHASIPHLLGSLFFLLVLGFYLEGAWGATLFSGVAIGSAVAAASAFGAVVEKGAGAWIGSAGVLAGLLGAFAVRFHENWRDVSRAVVFATGCLFLAVPVVIGVQWSVVRAAGPIAPSASGIAYAAAFAFGVAAALGLRVTQLEQVFGRRTAAPAGRGVRHGAQLDRALEHHAAGRLEQSFTLLTNILRQSPDDRDAALAFWGVATDLGRPAAAASALLGVIRDEVKRGATDAAVQHWLELAEAGLVRDAEPALSIRMAALLAAADQRSAAADALRGALLRAEGASGTALASRVARAASSIDPATAAQAAWQALGSIELTLEERQGLEGLLAEALPRNAAAAARMRNAPARPPVVKQPSQPTSRAEVESGDPEKDLLEIVESDPEVEPEPAAAPPPEVVRAPEPRKPDAIEIETSSRTLEAIFAVPTELDADGVCIAVVGGAKKRVRYDRISAVSVVAISNLGPKPVIVVDLVLNWMSLSDEPLRIIRLRGDRFDPRKLVPDQTAPVDALRAIIARVLRESGAAPLPDLQSARGLPFAGFDDLASYHRDVLMVDGDNAEAYAWSPE